MGLACLLLKTSEEEHLVAIPRVLPMGWTKSPPYFCALTETIVDITNSSFIVAPKHPPYRLKRYINLNENVTPTIPTLWIPHHWCKQRNNTPIANTDVYIDDISVYTNGLNAGQTIHPTQIPQHRPRFPTNRPKGSNH
jgi:hypothetical protein